MIFALYRKGVWAGVSQVSPCTAAAVRRASTFRTFTEVLPQTTLAINNSGKHYAVLLACSLHEDISVSVDASFMNGNNHLSSDVCVPLLSSSSSQHLLETHVCLSYAVYPDSCRHSCHRCSLGCPCGLLGRELDLREGLCLFHSKTNTLTALHITDTLW